METNNHKDIFLDEINKNMSIIHKVANIYFSNADDREDARQEILYQLWKSYPGYKGDAKFSTWMYKVALNTAITYVKKGNKILDKEMLPENYSLFVENNEQAEINEKLNLLYAAINTLSGIDKAITLLYLEDKSYDEISAITGFTKSNVSVRLVRIRLALREKLKNIM